MYFHGVLFRQNGNFYTLRSNKLNIGRLDAVCAVRKLLFQHDKPEYQRGSHLFRAPQQNPSKTLMTISDVHIGKDYFSKEAREINFRSY
jgi:hypothetical protein